MRFSFAARAATALLVFACAYAVVAVPVGAAKASKAPVYSLANVGAYGGEPSITANSKGELYDTTPSGVLGR